MYKLIALLTILFSPVGAAATESAQENLKKVYDETIDPLVQLDNAIASASQSRQYVLCQLGGNWCKWCLRLAQFVSQDEEISKLIKDNYKFIHVNYNPRIKNRDSAEQAKTDKLLKRLGNPGRFGYPVLIVLDGKGRVLHIQDSSFLEEGDSYSRNKVLRFLRNWTPSAVNGK